MSQFALTFPGGKLEHETILHGDNFSVDTTHHRVTCAAGKRLLFKFCYVYRDVNATLTVNLKDADDKLLMLLHFEAAGVGDQVIPETTGLAGYAHPLVFPFPMKAGDYIEFVFSVAQTATAKINSTYLEIDAP